MKNFRIVASATAIACACAAFAQAPDDRQQQADLARQFQSLEWVHGPAIVPIGDEAKVRLPEGMRYLDVAGTDKFLKLTGNLPAGQDYTIAPETSGWFAILDFVPTGYVSDTEQLDPDAVFKQMKSNEVEGNKERASAGQPALYLDRWVTPPHYDAASHNLEWGTVMHSESGEKVVNYTSRILGRDGVTRAVLVSDPANLPADLREYRAALSGFAYLRAKKYEDHRAGDKMAEYGLGALVAGGAAAAVVKTGLFAGIFAAIVKFGPAFYKLILVGVLALYAALRRQIGRLFTRATPGGGDDQIG